MTRFALRFPYFIIVACLITVVVGVTSLVRLPVDLFPAIRIPVVVVATFYSGMPPEQIETDITGRFERFFTLASGIDHIESRSLPGVSLIKVYFQPGSDPDSAVTSISNLAMANLRRLPPGTLPPVVLKFDASSLPVCLVTLKGEGLDETHLRDLAQYTVRNQIAGVPGASVPQPFGGRYRQIMIYVDPLKLEAHQLSIMDVVRTVNDSNLILPAGDVKIGPFDYNIYTNSQLRDVDEINHLPLKMINNAPVLVGDVGKAMDAAQIQTNVVKIDGQPSVYLPILKQGGDSNTIAVVDGVKRAIGDLLDVPRNLVVKLAFDQSLFVKSAIENLIHEGLIGMVLTGIMILLFLGNWRATTAVFLSIPLSALATFIALSFGSNSVNTMVLGGLALAFSRLIDNSVVVLENIYRYIEMGEKPAVAAQKGGDEVALPVLAATLTTAIVFFPVTFLYGVSRFLFSALAITVVLALLASYIVAMTVVPLFCAHFISAHEADDEFHRVSEPKFTFLERVTAHFNVWFQRLLDTYNHYLRPALDRSGLTVAVILIIFALSLCLYPFVGKAYFPRTDPGQFVINVKAATGTRLERTEELVAQAETKIREIVPPDELETIVDNLGVTADFSAIYTPNSASHTGFILVALKEGHRLSSYEYMDKVRSRLKADMPELRTFFQTGGLVDAILNMGLPAPINLQISGSQLNLMADTANKLALRTQAIESVDDAYIPQDQNAPSLSLEIDRVRASQLGLTPKEVVSNVITALTSNAMIAPSYWVDPKSGYDYLLTVQYPEAQIQSLEDFASIPLRSAAVTKPTQLDAAVKITHTTAPTEVDHYQLRRVVDIFVNPKTEDLSTTDNAIQKMLKDYGPLPEGLRLSMRGSVEAMNTSFRSFGLGLILSIVLVYLVLVAQFRSFLDPFIILLAVPPGLTGVILTLLASGTTLNVMSLMGIVMMTGIVVSNSILIVEFAHHLQQQGRTLRESVAESCRVRMRPILMTSLATILGLIPMALKLGTGSEAYAPLARAIIGGLCVSLVCTMFLVPAACLLFYDKEKDDYSPIPQEPVETVTT